RLTSPFCTATPTHLRCAGAVCTSMSGRFSFSLSSFSAYRLADFLLLPAISQHRLPVVAVSPLSRQKNSSLYLDEQALQLFLLSIFFLECFCDCFRDEITDIPIIFRDFFHHA